jgi:rubrerythrin
MAKEQEKKSKWKCTVCGYVQEGGEPPPECPVCGAPRDKFVRIE